MGGPRPHELIEAIRGEIEQAAEAMLSAAERGIRDVRRAREGEPKALDRIEEMLFAILEACAFQDLAGQRLTGLTGLLGPETAADAQRDPLLNGPAAPGVGLDQASADEILSERSS